MAKGTRKPARTWVYSPPKSSKTKVPDDLRIEVAQEADKLIAELKPLYIEDARKEHFLNYIVDLYTKWVGSYFYFCAKYACPGPNALAPSFESKFARMEYLGKNIFNLSYMRHTGKWMELERGLTLQECMQAIKEGPHYTP